jgi:hypothetical protein
MLAGSFNSLVTCPFSLVWRWLSISAAFLFSCLDCFHAVCFTSDIESIIIAVRHIVVTSQLRCSCDRCCLQYAVQLLIFLRQRSLLLLVYFAVGKTGAVLRSDNFAGCKIVVAARSTTRFAETAQLNRLHFQLFVYHAIGSDHHI